jgi:hypothetical protein
MKLISFTLAVYDKLLQKGYSSFVLKSTIKGNDREYCNGRAMQILQPSDDFSNKKAATNTYNISIDKLKDMLTRNDADYYIILSNDL